MSDFKRALLVYNPVAKTAGDPDLWLGSVIHGLCESGDCVLTVRPTRAGCNGDDLSADIEAPLDFIVVAGGDGTIRAVLEALIESKRDLPVGLVPVGTGNQLARNLGIYEDNLLGEPLQDALQVILGGHSRRIDVGRMNGSVFTVAAGAGPMSDAVIMPGREDKTNWRMLAYASTMIQTLAMPPVVFRVTVDGSDSFKIAASGIFVTNVASLGMGSISETAHLDDGLLDLCILNPKRFTDYLELGFRFAGGFFGGEAPYYIRKAKTVDIEVVRVRSSLSALQRLGHRIRSYLKGEPPSRPTPPKEVIAMIDGDACGTTPMHVEVIPDAVRIFAPTTPPVFS